MTTNYNYISRQAQFLKLFLIAALAFTLGTQNSYATHAAGGNITYTHVSGNTYTLHLTFYRDCIGIPITLPIIVNVSSASCAQNATVQLDPIPGTGQEITHPCPGHSTTCTGGTEPGIQKWEFEGTYSFPAQCTDWTISIAIAARNAAITTLQNPGGDNIYIEAHLNNSVSDNTSPQFSVDPIVFVCMGQPFVFNNGAIDPDGDSLVYSFIAPRTDANTDVIYANGYSVTNPISSTPAVTIDPVTGDITMNATAQEVGVMAVLILEYRNGVLIGTVMRDIQIYTVPCTNALPTCSGINGGTNFSMTACAGSNICFDILSNDLDAGQTLTMTWNNGVPGTLTTVGSPHPTGHFCWATQASDARTQPYTFAVTIRDDNCPSNGAQVYSYSITLGALTATASSTPASCNGSHNGTATTTIAGGTSPFQYLWSPGQLTGQTITGLAAGSYSVVIVDSNGCQATQTVLVSEPAALVTTIANLQPSSCGAPGSFDIVTAGGTPVYTYFTNTVPSQTGSTVTAAAGTYTVTVRDAHNCRTLTPVTITSTGTLSATETHTNVSCNGASDGTATITLTGGLGNEVYTWTPNVSTGTSASGLAAGSYTVDITNGTCSTQVVITITEPSPLVATETHTNVGCNGASTGNATVSVAGGGTFTYTWTPNVSTGSSATNIAAGTYTVDISNGACSTQVVVTITEPTALVLTTSSTPDSCTTGNGTTSVTVMGGTGPYSYSWSPSGGTGATASGLTAGSYVVTVTDANGCTATETVVVASDNSHCCTLTLVTASTPERCGNQDGMAVVAVSGGVGPYAYSWSPSGGTSAAATGLMQGNYSVTVSDANGCSSTESVSVGEDTSHCCGCHLVLTTSSTPELCGQHNGTATVVVTGGTQPITYSWSPAGGSGSTASGLDEATYTVTVTDANGCTATATVSVASDFSNCCNITLTTSFIAETCGLGNGQASVVVAGGTAPYTYSWSPAGGSGATASGLDEDTYTVTVTDANGCTANATVVVPSDNSNCGGRYSGSTTGGNVITTYPNPAHDQVLVSIGKIKDVMVTIQLTDVIGKVVYSNIEKSSIGLKTTINISSLPSGVYMLKVEYLDQKKVIKIIKN